MTLIETCMLLAVWFAVSICIFVVCARLSARPHLDKKWYDDFGDVSFWATVWPVAIFALPLFFTVLGLVWLMRSAWFALGGRRW